MFALRANQRPEYPTLVPAPNRSLPGRDDGVGIQRLQLANERHPPVRGIHQLLEKVPRTGCRPNADRGVGSMARAEPGSAGARVCIGVARDPYGDGVEAVEGAVR